MIVVKGATRAKKQHYKLVSNGRTVYMKFAEVTHKVRLLIGA